jgi:cytochrome P450
MTIFDPLSREIRVCPHPHYPHLNAEPVQHIAGHPNFWTVAGHATVTEVLLDPETFDGQPIPGHALPIMSAMRPEPHKRLRNAVQAMFTRRALEQLTGVIEDQARRRTANLLSAGGGDLMTLWANPVPLSVIATMFGFPHTDADLARLHRYGDAAVRVVIPYGGSGLPPRSGPRARLRQLRGLAAAIPAAARLAHRLPRHERANLRSLPNPLAHKPGYPRTGLARDATLARPILDFTLEVLTIFENHVAQPGSTIIDALIPPYTSGELSLAEILAGAGQILVAGYETTANALASSVHRLADDPAHLNRIHEDAGYLEAFIEETLRIDAPLQRTLRRTTRPVTLAGTRLPENAQLIVMLGAANVDPGRHPCPEQFDPQRPDVRKHLAFGTGIHVCIGAQLARLEARIALATFADQIASVQLDPDDPPTRLVDRDIGMWGFNRLPVRVTARTAGAVPKPPPETQHRKANP